MAAAFRPRKAKANPIPAGIEGWRPVRCLAFCAAVTRQGTSPIRFGAERGGTYHKSAETTSSPVGKRPVAFFEKRSLPSTVISKAPPRLLRRTTVAAGVFAKIMSRAARARGS